MRFKEQLTPHFNLSLVLVEQFFSRTGVLHVFLVAPSLLKVGDHGRHLHQRSSLCPILRTSRTLSLPMVNMAFVVVLVHIFISSSERYHSSTMWVWRFWVRMIRPEYCSLGFKMLLSEYPNDARASRASTSRDCNPTNVSDDIDEILFPSRSRSLSSPKFWNNLSSIDVNRLPHITRSRS